MTSRGDRVAILAPQGLDYVTCFFAAIQAANIAVPLFAPELPGHAERLDAVLTDALPAVVLTTTKVSDAIQKFVRLMPREKRPRIIAVDAIPDSVGSTFVPSNLDTDDIAYLQYTSGSTRVPTGVEISHRAAGTNLLQMVFSIDLEGDFEINGASWLPLYHDMGLMMVGFPDPLRRESDLHVADGVRPPARALDPDASTPPRATVTSSRPHRISRSSWSHSADFPKETTST